jgi:hypothetical protein
MLSDDALLEIFSSLREICQSDEFYLSRANEKECQVDSVGTHMPKVATHHLCITLSLAPGALLRTRKIGEEVEVTGHLAELSYLRMLLLYGLGAP